MRAVDAGDLVVERTGHVVWVTFNRPEARNDDLHDLCDELDPDADVRVAVVRGAGDTSFAAGTDIRQFLSFETRGRARLRGAHRPRAAPALGAEEADARDGAGRRRRRRSLPVARLRPAL